MTDEARLAVLEATMTDIKKDIGDMRAEIKALTNSVNQLVSANTTKTLELTASISELEREIDRLKKREGLWKWLSPTLAAITGSIFTYLIIEFIKTR